MGKDFLPDLKWYMEKYLELPVGAYVDKARKVEQDMQTWGAAVFVALFCGDAAYWFNKACEESLDKLQIRITSGDDDLEVLSWPWEALYQERVGYIAIQSSIERRLQNVMDPVDLSKDMPRDVINVLYVISRPYGETDVAFQTLIRPTIEYAKQSGAVHIDLLRPPTFDRLQEVLQEKKGFYHIIHFDGHGGYGIPIGGNHHSSGLFAGVQGELVFEKQSGGADEIPADKLAALLRQYQIPIMVLNACQSAMADGNANDIFACVAASLIRVGIRSVVAIQYSLYVAGAKVFVPEFYKRLFETGSVTEAIQQGRREMYRHQERVCLTGYEKLEDWLVRCFISKELMRMYSRS
jgi:CHAT domain-containing protein